MAITPLPPSPNLENLKKRAKTLLKSVRAGDPVALDQVGPYFGNPASIGLQQAQLVIARSYGFSSWTRLKRHVEGKRDESGNQLASRFLDLVIMAYGPVPNFGPERFRQAVELLAEHPEIRQDSIYTAAAIGDVGEIDRWLDRDETLINKRGGYFGWEPLMYAAYARLPGASTLAAGLRLLERGADPNAYYMWGGQYKFTALTGVFGQGEGGPINQPEHPDCVAFARALLDLGANPNDSQAAYNRCFEPDNTCLELLLEYGLSASDKNNWLLVEDDRRMPHPSETMYFQLISAIKRGYADRVRLLVDHGVDLNKPDDTYDTRTKGKTPYQTALLMGEDTIAEMLAEAGADTGTLTAEDAFQVACMAGDLSRAREIMDQSGDALGEVRRTDMLRDAAKRGNRKALEVMIELGFDVNGQSGCTALHEAALSGDVDLAQMLLAAGADPTIRDNNHYATPMGWALHAEDAAMIALLDECRMDIFTAAARGNIEQLKARLGEDSARVHLRFAELLTGDNPPENGWTTPLIFAVAGDHPEAVRLLLEAGSDLSVADGKGTSVLTIAEKQAGEEVRAELARFATGTP